MASLRKRGDSYYIRFSRTISGKKKTKALSLGTGIKREAEKLLLEYEDKFKRGEIDPFKGWTPKLEAERKRQKLSGKYISLEKATEQFINERSQANARTKKNYRKHLEMLMDQLGRTMPLTEILESDIRSFCFKSNLSPATQASYLRHLKVFFNWLEEKQILRENITKSIKSPRIPQKISQKTVNRDELDEIIEAFEEFNKEMMEKGFITKPAQRRDWFVPMINTIYYCGLRAKEAVNLTWNDIDLKKTESSDNYGFVRISNTDTNTTKSGKERIIPIRKPLYPYIKRWYEDQERPKDGYVFPSATGFDRWHKMDSLALSRSFKKGSRQLKEI